MLSSGDLWGLLMVYGYVTVVVLLIWILGKRSSSKWRRKTVHILIGNIVFFWWIFDSSYVMSFLAAAPFIPILLMASPSSPSARLRKSLLGMATTEGHDLGLVYYAISWTLLAFFYFDFRVAASVGIIAMAYGDGMGGLIGARYGRNVLMGHKTMEGTLAVFISTMLMTVIVLSFYQLLNQWGIFASSSISLPMICGLSILIGGYVAIAELISPGEYDNLIVPLSTALMLAFLGV